MQSGAPGALTCGVPYAETAPLRSSAGFTAVLKMQSGDAHSKDYNFCETDYTLQVTLPEGSASALFDVGLVSIADWDRPIVFRVEGFSPDGRHVFVLISEDKYPSSVDAMEFDMSSGARSKEVSLDSHFTRRLSPACAATLHIFGISSTGLMVLGSSAKEGCARADLWQLRPNKPGSVKTGYSAPPEYPKRLSPSTRIVVLDPGVAVQP